MKKLVASVALLTVYWSIALPLPYADAQPRECFGRKATIVGTPGPDRLIGTRGADVIVGLDGPDVIRGRGGNDRICGDDDVDRMVGNRGRDRISSGQHDCYDEALYEILNGGRGRDALYGGPCLEKIFGGRGPDRMRSGTALLTRDLMFGGRGDDDIAGAQVPTDTPAEISGGPGDDRIDGGTYEGALSYRNAASGVYVDLVAGRARGEGRDVISRIQNVYGSRYRDVIIGDDGHGNFDGARGRDRIESGAGDDLLAGGPGHDRLDAGPDDDFLIPEGGDDRVDGGAGIDEAHFSSADRPLHIDLALGTASGEGADTLTGIENFGGGPHDDTLLGDDEDNRIFEPTWSSGNDTIDGRGGDDHLSGGHRADTLRGGPGDDDISGGRGDDLISGGEGTDLARFREGPIHVDLLEGTATGQGHDTLDGIENLIGSQEDDTLLGDDGPNLIDHEPFEGSGNDTIDGRGGDDALYAVCCGDILIGGSGDDALYGGFGDDDLDGGEGFDSLDGGDGNDRCRNGEVVTNCES